MEIELPDMQDKHSDFQVGVVGLEFQQQALASADCLDYAVKLQLISIYHMNRNSKLLFVSSSHRSVPTVKFGLRFSLCECMK